MGSFGTCQMFEPIRYRLRVITTIPPAGVPGDIYLYFDGSSYTIIYWNPTVGSFTPTGPTRVIGPNAMPPLDNRDYYAHHMIDPTLNSMNIDALGVTLVGINHGWGGHYEGFSGLVTKGTFYADSITGILDVTINFDSYKSAGAILIQQWARAIAYFMEYGNTQDDAITGNGLGLCYGANTAANTETADIVRPNYAQPSDPVIALNLGTHAYILDGSIMSFRIRFAPLSIGGDPAGTPYWGIVFAEINVNAGAQIYGGAIVAHATRTIRNPLHGLKLFAGAYTCEGCALFQVRVVSIVLTTGIYQPA